MYSDKYFKDLKNFIKPDSMVEEQEKMEKKLTKQIDRIKKDIKRLKPIEVNYESMKKHYEDKLNKAQAELEQIKKDYAEGFDISVFFLPGTKNLNDMRKIIKDFANVLVPAEDIGDYKVETNITVDRTRVMGEIICKTSESSMDESYLTDFAVNVDDLDKFKKEVGKNIAISIEEGECKFDETAFFKNIATKMPETLKENFEEKTGVSSDLLDIDSFSYVMSHKKPYVKMFMDHYIELYNLINNKEFGIEEKETLLVKLELADNPFLNEIKAYLNEKYPNIEIEQENDEKNISNEDRI